MTSLLIASQIGLWLITAFVLLAIFVLARQIGLLHRRLAPSGARMELAGPAIGDAVPELDASDLFGRRVTLGVGRGKQTLLVFVAPTCPACADLMPSVRSIARSEKSTLEVVLLSLDYSDERLNRDYVAAHELDGFGYVVSKQAVAPYGVIAPPYALLIDSDGRLAAKGVVNHLEHLESLLNASRPRYASRARYMAGVSMPQGS